MRQIVNNRFLKSFTFNSHEELSKFTDNQEVNKSLWIDDYIGNQYICYVCCDSLTSEKIFHLSFSSDRHESELNFLFWDQSKLLVVESNSQVNLIDEDLTILSSLEITSPIIGFHVTNMNNLLVLAETSMRLVDFEGRVLMWEVFDLVEEFSLDENTLRIKTVEESKSFILQ